MDVIDVRRGVVPKSGGACNEAIIGQVSVSKQAVNAEFDFP